MSNIQTNYGQVRAAYIALTSLSREGLQIKLAAALRWKRILGVLRPLLEQMEEQQRELEAAHSKPAKGKKDETELDMPAFNTAIAELFAVPCEVGSDLVLAADFGAADGIVSSKLAALLMDLGPFFADGDTTT